MALKRKQLQAAATELSEKLNLDPKIDPELPDDELVKQILEGAEFIKEAQEEDGIVIDPKVLTIVDELKNPKLSETPVPVATPEAAEEAQAPATKKGKSGKKPAKKVKTDKPPKAEKTSSRIAFLEPLIEKGKFTRVQLVEKAQAKFPEATISALSTILSDAKNPKYNKFSRLVVENDKKILSFK